MRGRNFELFIFSFLFLILLSFGFIIQYSASFKNDLISFKKQLVFFIIFEPISLFFCFIFFDKLKQYIYYIYLSCIIVLFCVFIIGKIAMGAQRWIEIGGLNFQPSEISKIILIFILAKYFSNIKYFNLNKIVYFIIPSLIVFIQVILIFIQPNLGTSIVVFCVGFGIILAFFNNKKFLISVLGVILILAPFIWNSVLHQYQKQRILTFLNPDEDLRGSGYNINQSKIAIGSGGIFGKNFLLGSQNKLSFLPEQHTDFVFTVFCEEFGFFWVFILILVFMILIFRIFYLINLIQNLEDKIILFGIGLLFSVHFFINTFMVSGFIPATGVPIPFLSYGRSFFLLNLLCMNFIFVIIYKNQKK